MLKTKSKLLYIIKKFIDKIQILIYLKHYITKRLFYSFIKYHKQHKKILSLSFVLNIYILLIYMYTPNYIPNANL